MTRFHPKDLHEVREVLNRSRCSPLPPAGTLEAKARFVEREIHGMVLAQHAAMMRVIELMMEHQGVDPRAEAL